MPSKNTPPIERTCERCGAIFRTWPSRIAAGRRFCSHSCGQSARFTEQTNIDRFWAKVDTSGDCWLWTAGKSPHGYGNHQLNGRKVVAHRFAYELTYGRIPDGLLVCHRCDVRACVNPEHLFLGTHTDNMQDMIAKGRKVVHAGTSSRWAKLSEDDVLEIRSLYDQGGFTHRTLAKRFGVQPSTISMIMSRQNWKHI